MHVSEHVLTEGCRLFGAAPTRALDGSEAALYEASVAGVRHMLRFSPITEDGLPRFRARWEFVEHLARSGVDVAAPIPSINGETIEMIDGSPAHHAWALVCVQWINGENLHPQRLSHTAASTLQAWGALMGRMHSVAGRLEHDERIADWREEATSFLRQSSEVAVRSRWQQMIGLLETMPTSRDGYGLVHNDLHYANIIVDGSRVAVVDFDVCAYHWFISDIAVAMQAVLWTEPSATVTDVASWSYVFREFMTGYRRENDLTAEWENRLPVFLEYRRLLLYTVFSHEWAHPTPWQSGRLALWRRGIVDAVPVLSRVPSPTVHDAADTGPET